MNPDYALILNFKLNDSKNVDADALVKKARDIGVRAVSGSDLLKEACEKYTIFLANEENGQDLTKDNVIETMVENRKNGKATIINIPVNEDGNFDDDTIQMLDVINNWMHMFGHAFNDGKVSELTVDQDGFVLENRHASYQQYVFVKSPIPENITISGLSEEPNRVEWIEHRNELKFEFEDRKLTVNLEKPDDEFTWEVLRIQAHRPEDDIAETKF
ncbi:hypothetical protein GCM10022297_00940 [Lactobacillus hamsteri]|uniref:Uncharacterized protein n=1 Tax=Lactobacillus hamsteri DSM 5661 = JCM 6256 TaxID=1423754 RepID=A0A0R1YCJ2_9LACO|nr:hypothetical protein [Lactobacillus hamsteri]KRM40065.1 hypothetical protein FC39_GL000882 [Lactobacillus hamsteri DSM 5661 = JCM 6256]